MHNLSVRPLALMLDSRFYLKIPRQTSLILYQYSCRDLKEFPAHFQVCFQKALFGILYQGNILLPLAIVQL